MSTLETIWILSETPERLTGLCKLARTIGTRVEAVVIGDSSVAQIAAASGVDKVHHLANDGSRILESFTPSIKKLMEEQEPQAVLFTTTKRTRLIAGKLAASYSTSVVTDVNIISYGADGLSGEHMVYGGSAFRVEQCLAMPGFFLVSDGACAQPTEQGGAEAPIISVEVLHDDGKVYLIDRKPRSIESVNLAVAKCVISVGRGIENKEDLGLIQELAFALEAELGCSRPIAEGNNWLARERYIGVSGVMLTPEVFIAVGVSGQVQHMVGATNSKNIFVINKDKNAPAFKYADCGIVGDLYDVVPKIIERLKA